MIVLLAWLAAVLVAAAVAAVLAFDALGHLRRLTAALAEAGQDLTPQVQGLVDRLPAPPNGPRQATGDVAGPHPAATVRTARLDQPARYRNSEPGREPAGAPSGPGVPSNASTAAARPLEAGRRGTEQ